jgi:glutathione S-transferase
MGKLSMTLIIHGSPLSPFTRKVTLAALEKNLNFQSHDLNPYTEQERLAGLNPLRRIPVIQHNEFTLADSSAICGYFEAAFPEMRALSPADAKAKGSALWIEEYADTKLFEAISEGVFRPIFINQLLGMEPDLAKVEDAVRNRLPEPLSYLENQLGTNNWFAGDQISIADIAVYSQMVNLDHAHRLPSEKDYPVLMEHYHRMCNRPLIASLLKSEQAFLSEAISALS